MLTSRLAQSKGILVGYLGPRSVDAWLLSMIRLQVAWPLLHFRRKISGDGCQLFLQDAGQFVIAAQSFELLYRSRGLCEHWITERRCGEFGD